jgi:phage-related minor tail protein
MCAFNAARGLPAALSDRNDYTGRNGPYQSMGDTVAQAGRNVGEYASDVTHRVTETASSYASSVSDYAGAQAGERLMSAAEERGLTGEGFKEVAREVGDAFSDALSGEETFTTTKRHPFQRGDSPAVPRAASR